MKRLSVPSLPASTRATMRRTRLQVPGGVEEFLEAADLAAALASASEAGRGARLQAGDVSLRRVLVGARPRSVVDAQFASHPSRTSGQA